MFTIEATTNRPVWAHVLEAMNTELERCEGAWTAVGGFRSHYYRPARKIERAVSKPVVRRKIMWSRIGLVALALGCVYAFQRNEQAAQQYQNDLQQVYSQLRH